MNTQINANHRFFIKTLGCKVNQYESQAMRELLLKSGFKECLSKETADIYIVNTCTVTHRADSESRYWAALFLRANPKAKIVLTGCGVEKDADRFSFLPGMSNIVKNEDKGGIAEILRAAPPSEAGNVREGDVKISAGDSSTIGGRSGPNFLSITDFKDHTKAFVKIQDGCENFCAYCKVPSVRGVSRSRPLKDILEEVGTLAAKDFKEIVLTGICLGAWGGELPERLSLVSVLQALNNIPGNFRIRLSSIEPKYVTDELIDYIAGNNKICRHLHIPIQSGDDEILSRMNRPYKAEQLKAIIIKVKDGIPDVGITTDILIGFPGETDKHFWNTVNLIKEIMPVRTHIFTFSKRTGTAAYSMSDTVADDILKQRFQRMRIAAITASYLYRERFINKRLDVLVESNREKHSGRLIGYSDNYIKVMLGGPDALMKKIVPVTIKELNLIHTLGIVQQNS